MDKIVGEWLFEDNTRAVMLALHAKGAKARFVGGCVRDALLRRAVKDIDIAIDIPPEDTLALIQSAGLKAVPTGIAHGTVTAIAGGKPFEVTSLRRDVSTDGRRAVVAFTDNWKQDAGRRDFTMNALYADADGTVHDVLNAGLDDLHAGRVRFIGDPVARIEEDYLRILRFFRFSAWYGTGEMDGRALVACANLASGMTSLSRERIGGEMLKLLGAPDPSRALDMMVQTGVLARALPDARSAFNLRALIEAERRATRTADGLTRMAYLTAGGDPVRIARAMKLSNAQMKALQARTPPDYAVTTPEAARRLGFERGTEAATDLLLFDSADRDAPLKPSLLACVREGAGYELPITAQDVMAAGVSPGPVLGAALQAAETAWIESDFSLDTASLMAAARKAARQALMREAENHRAR